MCCRNTAKNDTRLSPARLSDTSSLSSWYRSRGGQAQTVTAGYLLRATPGILSAIQQAHTSVGIANQHLEAGLVRRVRDAQRDNHIPTRVSIRSHSTATSSSATSSSNTFMLRCWGWGSTAVLGAASLAWNYAKQAGAATTAAAAAVLGDELIAQPVSAAAAVNDTASFWEPVANATTITTATVAGAGAAAGMGAGAGAGAMAANTCAAIAAYSGEAFTQVCTAPAATQATLASAPAAAASAAATAAATMAESVAKAAPAIASLASDVPGQLASSGWPWWLLGAVLIIAGIAGLAMTTMRHSRQPSGAASMGEEDSDSELEEDEVSSANDDMDDSHLDMSLRHFATVVDDRISPHALRKALRAGQDSQLVLLKLERMWRRLQSYLKTL